MKNTPDALDIINDLKKVEKHINQLADIVNAFQKGKVRAEDFTEDLKKAMKKLTNI